jgi:hypothetical protein
MADEIEDNTTDTKGTTPLQSFNDQQPNRSPFLRAPLPPNAVAADPDALRQFYRAAIPQFRLPAVPGAVGGALNSGGTTPGAATTTTTASSSSTSDPDPYMHWVPLTITTAGAHSNPVTRTKVNDGNVALVFGPLSVSVTPVLAPLPGDVLFVTFQYFNSNAFSGNAKGEPTTRTVSDNVGNVWVEVAHVFNPDGNGSADIGEGMSMWVCLNPFPSIPTVTVTINRTGSPNNDQFQMGVWYSDISGVTALKVDRAATGFTDLAFTATPTLNFTTTVTDFIYVAFSLFSHAFGISGTPGPGYTSNVSLMGSPFNAEYADQYAGNISAGAQSPSMTSNISVNHWMYIGVGLNTTVSVTQASPSYVINDVIRYQGIEYICIANNTAGILPDTPGWTQYWQIVCAGTQDNNVNLQNGTAYTILDSDFSKLISFSSTLPVAVTLPQAGTNFQFNAGWYCYVENLGVGPVTITPTVSKIDNLSSITLTQTQGIIIFTDGINYYTLHGLGTAGVTGPRGITGPQGPTGPTGSGSGATGSNNEIFATPANGSTGAATLRIAVVNDYRFHSESLTNGLTGATGPEFIFINGDVVTVVGVPN